MRLNASQFPTTILFLFIFSLLIITRPYPGVTGDGLFYAIQAINILNPSAFKHDIFFLYGSQDQYTLFTNLYAYLINYLGLGKSSVILEFVGLSLWFIAIAHLVTIIPPKPRFICLILIITLNNSYGSHSVLGYAEASLTARLYAEAFALFSLGFILKQNYKMGIIFILASTIMHPLIALPVLIIILGIQLNFKYWLLLLCSGGMLALLLGVLSIPPFSGLLVSMDKSWWDYNINRSPFVFLNTWTWNAYSQVLLTISILLAVILFSQHLIIKKLAKFLLATLALMFTISYLGGSLLRLPFIISLQLHRIMWLAVVLNPFFIIHVVYEKKQENSWALATSILLLTSLFLNSEIQGIFSCIIISLGFLCLKFSKIYTIPTKVWIIIALLPATILLISIVQLITNSNNYGYITQYSIWRIYLSSPFLTIPIFLIFFTLLNSDYKINKILVSLLILIFSFFAYYNWYDYNLLNIKNKPETYYDSLERQLAVRSVNQVIPLSATIYWIESPEKAWFWLKRANYLSFDQGAGAVFNQKTTEEIIRRSKWINNVSAIDSRQNWNDKPIYSDKLLSQSILDTICQDKQINYIIAKNYDKNIKTLAFSDPITTETFKVYACTAT